MIPMCFISPYETALRVMGSIFPMICICLLPTKIDEASK